MFIPEKKCEKSTVCLCLAPTFHPVGLIHLTKASGWIEKQIIAFEKNPPNNIPHASVLIYAARNIVSPNLIVPQIPDLLDLLTTLHECHYKKVLEYADNALVFDQYYRRRGMQEPVKHLTDIERKRLETIKSQAAGMRKYYLRLVGDYCKLVRLVPLLI
jgi:hypothetical protein